MRQVLWSSSSRRSRQAHSLRCSRQCDLVQLYSARGIRKCALQSQLDHYDFSRPGSCLQVGKLGRIHCTLGTTFGRARVALSAISSLSFAAKIRDHSGFRHDYFELLSAINPDRLARGRDYLPGLSQTYRAYTHACVFMVFTVEGCGRI